MSRLPEKPAGTSVPASADVARLAGVSRATVSYALNDNTTVRISESTRCRVREAAAADLGYVPHAAAHIRPLPLRYDETSPGDLASRWGWTRCSPTTTSTRCS